MNRLKPNDTIYVLSYTHYERKSNAQEGGNVVMGLYSTMENAEEAAHIRRYEREYEIGEVKQILPVDITPIKVKKLLELSVKYAEKKIERFDAPLNAGIPIGSGLFVQQQSLLSKVVHLGKEAQREKYPWLTTYMSVDQIEKDLDKRPYFATRGEMEDLRKGFYALMHEMVEESRQSAANENSSSSSVQEEDLGLTGILGDRYPRETEEELYELLRQEMGRRR